MSLPTHLPRCSARLANPKRHSQESPSLAMCLLALLLTTASLPASADESPDRFVGPPSRLQPRLSNETGTPAVTAVPDSWKLNGPTRVSRRESTSPSSRRSAKNHIGSPTGFVNPFAPPDVLMLAQAPPAAQATPLAPPEAQPAGQAPPDLLNFNERQAEPDLQESGSQGEPDLLASEPIAPGQPLPCYVARPMAEVSTNIAFPEGDLPRNAALECVRTTDVVYDPRMAYGWAQFDFHWAPTCLCHGPLYFEEINAERYGYTVSYLLQPVISAGRFFLTIPALPYKMAVDPPHECIYTLGHYRPGSCAPWRANHLPLKVGAAIVEVGTIAGLILLVP